MSQGVQIRCIKKTNRFYPHHRISHVGGDGWKRTQEQAINLIETGQNSFYVSAWGSLAWVIVSVSRWGHKYLKTQNDGEQPDNLLRLPECV